MQSHNAPLTDLLQRAAHGERGALDRVFTVLYPDLRRIAHARLRGWGSADPQTTALVHESFLRLVSTSELALSDRKHFFAYAAKTMRNIIIELAREHHAQRRGGGHRRLQLNATLAGSALEDRSDESLVAVSDALSALEAIDPALAQVVEMRYFGGYSEAEIADLTGSSERTVRRRWEKARAFLLTALEA
jgi:RNA polymerase sigma factor (TIGR02999 family)